MTIINPSKIEWDLTNRPLLKVLDTQVFWGPWKVGPVGNFLESTSNLEGNKNKHAPPKFNG